MITSTTSRFVAHVGATAVVSYLALRANVVGMVRFVLVARRRFGLLKAAAFAVVMRIHHMPALPSTSWDGFVALPVSGRERLVSSSSSSSVDGGGATTTTTVGILFLPGALVDPVAYAPFLRDVSNAVVAEVGVDVAVTTVCAEYPFRNPILFSFERVSEIVEERPYVDAWIVVGHSMGAGVYGAAGAVSWSRRRLRDNDDDDVDDKIRGLVMLAGTITGRDVDLSGERDLEVLAVLADRDTVVPPDGTSETGDPVRSGIDERCPKRTTRTVVVEGGNHAGFGHYGPQTFPFPDGAATVTREEQQRIATEHLVSLTRRVLNTRAKMGRRGRR